MIYLMMIDVEDDRRKFVVLYEKYRCLMMTVAISILKDNYLAEDAVHEAFIKVAKNIDKFGDVDRIETKRYLISIVKSTAIDIYRKRNRQQENEIIYEPEKFENKKIAYLETEEENSILQVIYDLPEKYREIIILRYSTGLEYAEIANILGITEETVRQRISRGKKKMERALKKQGGIRWIE